MMQCQFYVGQSEVGTRMGVQINLVEGIREKIKDGLKGGTYSVHERRPVR